MREFLRRFKLELVSLATKAHAIADRADTLALMIQRLEGDPAKVMKYADAFAAGFNGATNDCKSDRELRERAAAGIRRFAIVVNPDGTHTARLDNCVVELPSKVGLLLEILAADTGASPDGMVAWKQPKDIAAIIGQMTGAPFHVKALNQLLCRLRAELRIHAHFHKTIIQRNPDHGLRLALLVNVST